MAGRTRRPSSDDAERPGRAQAQLAPTRPRSNVAKRRHLASPVAGQADALDRAEPRSPGVPATSTAPRPTSPGRRGDPPRSPTTARPPSPSVESAPGRTATHTRRWRFRASRLELPDGARGSAGRAGTHRVGRRRVGTARQDGPSRRADPGPSPNVGFRSPGTTGRAAALSVGRRLADEARRADVAGAQVPWPGRTLQAGPDALAGPNAQIRGGTAASNVAMRRRRLRRRSAS